jgi:3-phytase
VTALVPLTLIFLLLLPLPRQSSRTDAPPRAGALLPTRATAAVPHDPDDPAIWISRSDPAKSLILGTDKQERTGGLFVFGLDGGIRQTIAPLDRPNNVDVEYGLRLAGTTVDVAVLTERNRHRLRVFGIPADGGALTDLAPDGIPVLEGETKDAAEPMGIALYRRKTDGAIFAIVAPKTGGASDYLWQYRLEDDGKGRVRGRFVRRFGAFGRQGAKPRGEIEAVAVDDDLGYVYYSDEDAGIHKYYADPDRPNAARELAFFGTDGYLGDLEGLAIYPTGPGTGYIISSDQVSRGSRLMLYPREGSGGNPNEHPRITMVLTTADATDGVEATAAALPGFPRGLLVMMNSRAKNFLIYRWEDVVPAAASGR